MPEKRVFRPPYRLSGVRNPQLIIIASEGIRTEPDYFKALALRYGSPKVHVEVLKRVETAPDPYRVLDQLRQFSRKYRLMPNDELWLVIDTDRWPTSTLSSVTADGVQIKVSFAISNPCFELWLLLHHTSLVNYNEDTLLEFQNNGKDGTTRTRLERELIDIVGSYNKSNLNTDCYVTNVTLAIKNAEESDPSPGQRWPQSLGTHVYRLARSILRLSQE